MNNQTIEVFINQCIEKGVTLTVQGDNIEIKGGKNIINSLRSLVRQKKKEILHFFSQSKNSLDPFDPATKDNPRLDLLNETELEAYNGWYATMRKPDPKYGMEGLSHEEAEKRAWHFLIESMMVMGREGRGRFKARYNNPLVSEEELKVKRECFKEKGWIRIKSHLLGHDIYLVKSYGVSVPDKSLERITPREIEALRGLEPEEVKILWEAKVLFGGEILMSDKTGDK